MSLWICYFPSFPSSNPCLLNLLLFFSSSLLPSLPPPSFFFFYSLSVFMLVLSRCLFLALCSICISSYPFPTFSDSKTFPLSVYPFILFSSFSFSFPKLIQIRFSTFFSLFSLWLRHLRVCFSYPFLLRPLCFFSSLSLFTLTLDIILHLNANWRTKLNPNSKSSGNLTWIALSPSVHFFHAFAQFQIDSINLTFN